MKRKVILELITTCLNDQDIYKISFVAETGQIVGHWPIPESDLTEVVHNWIVLNLRPQ